MLKGAAWLRVEMAEKYVQFFPLFLCTLFEIRVEISAGWKKHCVTVTIGEKPTVTLHMNGDLKQQLTISASCCSIQGETPLNPSCRHGQTMNRTKIAKMQTFRCTKARKNGSHGHVCYAIYRSMALDIPGWRQLGRYMGSHRNFIADIRPP